MSNSCRTLAGFLVILSASLAAGCGGGGGSPAVVTPTLVSVALSPTSLSLAVGATAQLTVTGQYSNGTSQTLAAAGETFKSSATSVATVSSSGLVTVVSGAASGATATITVTDSTTGIVSAASASAIVTVKGAGAPSAASVSAATSTAQDNAMCSNISGYYWEIGDANGPLASGSVGADSQGNQITASTQMSIASASKWVYGTYIVQVRGSASALTSNDVPFMHFTSGYTNMGTSVTSSECPTDTVNECLAQVNPNNGQPFSYQDPANVGAFDYDGGHLENHASLYGGLGNTPKADLGSTIGAEIGNLSLSFTQPLIPGGIYTNAGVYAQMLRGILSGSLAMHGALGIDPVCTLSTAPGCNAISSPIPEAWHYSIAHWVEDDPATNGDGAFSSPGAFGFYPWIDSTKTYYGIIAREVSPVGTGEQEGYASAQCGRLIRHAFITGSAQTGQIPSN